MAKRCSFDDHVAQLLQRLFGAQTRKLLVQTRLSFFRRDFTRLGHCLPSGVHFT